MGPEEAWCLVECRSRRQGQAGAWVAMPDPWRRSPREQGLPCDGQWQLDEDSGLGRDRMQLLLTDPGMGQGRCEQGAQAPSQGQGEQQSPFQVSPAQQPHPGPWLTWLAAAPPPAPWSQ